LRRRDLWFVIPPNLVLLDFAGAADAFRVAIDRGAPWRLRFATATTVDGVATTSLGIGLSGFGPLPKHLGADALVIVSGASASENSHKSKGGRLLVEWLRNVAAPARCQLACVCSGALLAAHAGLLDGRRCTTHHALIEALRKAAPHAEVLDSRVFVEDGNLYTSAGITAGIDLALYLIAKLDSPRLSAEVARELVVYLRRAPEDPAFSPWIDGRNHMDARVHAVQDQLIRAPDQEWSLAQLARTAHMSVRTLTRRFREVTGVSVHEYHARLRVALAKQALAGGASVEGAAERAGIGSARQLRRLWTTREAGKPGEIASKRVRLLGVHQGN
jgi:transcriptional regulator GlxA family with amidase domain